MSQNGGSPGVAVYQENGRHYGLFRQGRYMFPIDEEERDRLDIFHRVVWLAREKKLYETFVPDRARVLDLGTGTGIWAIDISDTLWMGPNNHGDILGLDLAYIQPRDVPSSVSYMQADIEEPWPVREVDYDLIHIQMMLGSVRDWTEIYRKAFRHLRPGGFLEHVEIEWKFRSDDNSLNPNAPLCTWSDALHRAMRTAGMPMDVNERTRNHLEELGFTDVTETIIKMPINPWNPAAKELELGRWFNLGASLAIEALSLAPLTRVERWSRDRVLELTAEVKKNLCQLNIHAYCRLYVWTARKPSQ